MFYRLQNMISIPITQTPFASIFEDDIGFISIYYDQMPSNIKEFRPLRILGQGDQGTVYLVEANDQQYALKIYKKDLVDPRQILESHLVLKSLDVAPLMYFLGEYDAETFILRKVYDLTLRDYLSKYPDLTNLMLEKCREVFSRMIAKGYFDFDFRLDNVMIGDDGESLIFIDPEIKPIDYDPVEVESFMDYISKMFDKSNN